MYERNLMIEKFAKKIWDYLTIRMDDEEMNRMNLENCRIFLFMGLSVCILLLFSEKLFQHEYSILTILSLIGFIVLTGLFYTNYQYSIEHPTSMFKFFVYVVLLFVAYFESGSERTEPVFVFLVMLLVIPPFITETPWKLILLILLTAFLAAMICHAVETRELFARNMLRLVPVTFLSCVVTCHVDYARIRTQQMNAYSKKTAEHDPLTGILNRGGGYLLIGDNIKNRISGTFLIIDVDDFKYVNDTYGHERGDEVLKEVARILKSSFKSSDIVMRMGGDEFIVYAIGMVDRHVVTYRLEKLVATVNEVPAGQDSTEHISVSIGGVINDGSYPTYESLYRVADQYLYATKSKGKNGFELYAAGFKG